MVYKLTTRYIPEIDKDLILKQSIIKLLSDLPLDILESLVDVEYRESRFHGDHPSMQLTYPKYKRFEEVQLNEIDFNSAVYYLAISINFVPTLCRIIARKDSIFTIIVNDTARDIDIHVDDLNRIYKLR